MNKHPKKPIDIDEDDMMGEAEIVQEKPEPAKSPESEAPHLGGLIDFPEREELEAKLTAAEERALRAVAEMENVRRREERAREDAIKYANKKLLEELIPILDSLEQSVAISVDNNDAAKSMHEGMQLILQMLQKVLAKFGIKELNPVNETFNPSFHEAMTMQENPEVAPNTILMVLQKGYQLHERIIRPARVIIAKAPS